MATDQHNARVGAVVFDLGGVVLESPLPAITRFEREQGVPAGFVAWLVIEGGPDGPWARLERGEVDAVEFGAALARQARDAGHTLDAAELLQRIEQAATPRPMMIDAIERLRTARIPVNDARVVGGLQRRGNLGGNRLHLLQRQGPPGDQVSKGGPFHQFQDQCLSLAMLDHGVDLADVRMVQRRKDFGFPWNRASRAPSATNASGSTFRATARARVASRARYTSPIPPAPSSSPIS